MCLCWNPLRHSWGRDFCMSESLLSSVEIYPCSKYNQKTQSQIHVIILLWKDKLCCSCIDVISIACRWPLKEAGLLRYHCNALILLHPAFYLYFRVSILYNKVKNVTNAAALKECLNLTTKRDMWVVGEKSYFHVNRLVINLDFVLSKNVSIYLVRGTVALPQAVTPGPEGSSCMPQPSMKLANSARSSPVPGSFLLSSCISESFGR